MRKPSSVLLVFLLFGGLFFVCQRNAAAEENGLERKPLLGWSSWSFVRTQPTAAKIKAEALALHRSGLQKLGYEYVNLDDFWYECPGPQGPNVDAFGRWVIDPSRFPPEGNKNGIEALADYVHSLGLKFGIYVTPGISKQAVARNTPIKGTKYTADQIAEPSVTESNYNCKGMVGIDFSKPGAQQYINSFADMFASWGVDYIKIDGLHNSNSAGDIKAWSNAFRQTGRPVVIRVSAGGHPMSFMPLVQKYSNQWAMDGSDIECYKCEKHDSSYPLTTWANVETRFDIVAKMQPYAGPGGFTDYDSVELGNGVNDGLTPAERRTQLSLWSMAASPLILGVDLTHLDKLDLSYLRNKAVLAVDQDGIAAKRVLDGATQQVFAKMEPNGDAIVGLFNTGEKTQTISITASVVGLPKSAHGYSVHDLWTGQSHKVRGAITATVEPHGVVLYRVKSL